MESVQSVQSVLDEARAILEYVAAAAPAAAAAAALAVAATIPASPPSAAAPGATSAVDLITSTTNAAAPAAAMAFAALAAAEQSMMGGTAAAASAAGASSGPGIDGVLAGAVPRTAKELFGQFWAAPADGSGGSGICSFVAAALSPTTSSAGVEGSPRSLGGSSGWPTLRQKTKKRVRLKQQSPPPKSPKSSSPEEVRV